MAVKQFFHDIDLVNVGQLIGARHQNVTTAQQDALATTLGAGNSGLHIFNTDLKRVFVWSGTAFVQQEITITGDIVFKGVIANPAAPALEMISGYQYAVGAAGTLTQAGVSFVPSAVVAVGDQVLVVSATEAYVINRNFDDNRLGAIEAKNTEQDGRLDAVESKNLEQDGRLDDLEAGGGIKKFFSTYNLVAGVPTEVTHALNLMDKDAFVLRVADSSGSDVSLDVDSVDVNKFTLRSLVALNGVKVTVIGL